MMDFTHIANPVSVHAYQIDEVILAEDGGAFITFIDGKTFIADKTMLARYTPVRGDYLVQQQDGYTYLNPKEVFERKYRPIDTPAPDHAAQPLFQSRANEDDLRAHALELAALNTERGHEAVVRSAESYFAFLKGAA